MYPCGPGLEALDELASIGLIRCDDDGNVAIRCKLYEESLRRWLKMSVPAVEPGSASKSSPVDFLEDGMLKDHVSQLLELAPSLAVSSPALATISAGIALEGVLLLELERWGSLDAETAALNQDVDQAKVQEHLRIKEKRPSSWTLAQMIEVASRCGLISNEASLISTGIRSWRNLVHPDVLRKKFPAGITIAYAEAALGVSPMILDEIRKRRKL